MTTRQEDFFARRSTGIGEKALFEQCERIADEVDIPPAGKNIRGVSGEHGPSTAQDSTNDSHYAHSATVH
jgi:hypothetical protein